MITARGLVEGNAKTRQLAEFAPDEKPRSLQLYGIDPRDVGEAVARLVGEGRVDHIDLNFGCPVPKVTRRGGGAAIPLKPRLLRAIVRAAVADAGARAGHDQGAHRHRRRALSRTSTPAASREERGLRRDRRCTRAPRRSSTTARRDWDAIAELKARGAASRCSATATCGRLGRAAHDARDRLRRRDRRPRLPRPAVALPRARERLRRPRARAAAPARRDRAP